MKKTTFPSLVLFAGALVFLSGCQTGSDLEASSRPISEVSVQDTRAPASSVQYKPHPVRENTTQTENTVYNDLLYREYSFGKRVEAGTSGKLWIIREKILRWTFLKTGTTAIWSLMKIKPFWISQSW